MSRTWAWLVLAAPALSAPPAPPHDIWVEAEACHDHDFTVVGREEAFAGCYGGAILQLQTGQECPPGGYHATFPVPVAEAGWYELWVAATRTESAPADLSPYTISVADYLPRHIQHFAVTEPYGSERTGQCFGWLCLGRYRLAAGETAVTFRCDERRRSDQAYLLYLDAIALRRAAPPTGEVAWVAGPERTPFRTETSFDAPVVSPAARLEVACDGEFRAFLDGDEIGTGSGWQAATSLYLARRLRPGPHRLALAVTPAGGGVLARLTILGRDGQRTTLCATGAGWELVGQGGERSPVRLLGPAQMPPYGDMEVQPVSPVPIGPTPIPFKTGNLSVDRIMKAARGEPLPPPEDHPELDDWHNLASIQTVEDYLCWLPLEPQRDQWDWAAYLHNCEQLEARGMRYAVYPWLHFPPHWAADSELWEPFLSLKTGRSTWAPSIWSPRTLEIFERFYRELHEAFGDRVREVFVSMACDYGEVGYPIGMADWVVPADYKGADFWCGDPLARADFRRFAIARHGSVAGMNTAWGTDFADREATDYPEWTATEGPDFAALAALPVAERARSRRRWLDFVDWYLDSMTDFAGRAVGISRRYYPNAPHEIKIGFGSERVMFGADYTAYVARSKQDGYTVRSTHGKLPPYFYRRFSTAAKHYGVPLVTEPPSVVTRDEEVERIFKDATCGTTEYFDYPNNLLEATDLFARYAWYLEGHHSLTDVAFFFPTTDHNLRPAQSLPTRLFEACNASRDAFDWDLLDERLVRDGALATYRTILMVEGNVVEADVLDLLRRWVEDGGLLIHAAGPLETVEGDTAFDREMLVAEAHHADDAAAQPDFQALLTQGRRIVGRGATVRLPALPTAALPRLLAELLAHEDQVVPGRSAPTLLDGRWDGVWTALLPNRILLYNSTAEARSVDLALDSAALARLGAAAPQPGQAAVDLPPRSLGSVELPSAEVVVP